MTFPLTFTATILTAVAVAGCIPDQPRAADPRALDVEVRVAASGSTDTAPRRLLMPGPAAKALGGYLAGWQARKVGNFALASSFLDQALAADPGDPYLRYQLFLVTLSAGKIDRAMELAAAIADDGRITGIVHLAVVLDLIRQGDLASAEARLASSDDDIGALLRNTLLAWVKAESGQTDAALTTLAVIGEKSQPQVFHDFQAGLISEQAGRDEQALAYYERAGKSVEDLSLRMAQRIGAFLERNGRADKAAELYSRYLKDRPESTLIAKALERLEDGGEPPPPIAGAAEGAAEVLLDVASAISQPPSARMALIYGRLATWLDPDLHLADMLVGSILESLERYEDAIAVYRQIPADRPLKWTAELRIARNLEQLERDLEATELFSRLAVHEPVRVEALAGLGDLHRRNKEFNSAAEAYGRALDGIDSIEAGHWRLLFKRGMAFERAKKWELAERDLEHALRLRPDQPYVLNYLAYSWADQGINLERAHGMLERAVSQRPNDGYIVDSLGWIFYRMKDFETAVRYLERAVELRSQDPTINDHLGDAYWRVGRFQEARFQWKRALSLDPEPEDVQTIEDKIRDGLNTAPDPEKDS